MQSHRIRPPTPAVRGAEVRPSWHCHCIHRGLRPAPAGGGGLTPRPSSPWLFPYSSHCARLGSCVVFLPCSQCRGHSTRGPAPPASPAPHSALPPAWGAGPLLRPGARPRSRQVPARALGRAGCSQQRAGGVMPRKRAAGHQHTASPLPAHGAGFHGGERPLNAPVGQAPGRGAQSSPHGCRHLPAGQEQGAVLCPTDPPAAPGYGHGPMQGKRPAPF